MPMNDSISCETAKDREAVLKHVLLGGPAWEENSASLLEAFCASVIKYKSKRIGAKRVKDIERLGNVGELWSTGPEMLTTFGFTGPTNVD